MEKQHNRGQEGAGIASVHLDAVPGKEYMFREKAQGKDAITEIFSRVDESFAGELLMGHLRYSTTGKSGLTFVHPSCAATIGARRIFACAEIST